MRSNGLVLLRVLHDLCQRAQHGQQVGFNDLNSLIWTFSISSLWAIKIRITSGRLPATDWTSMALYGILLWKLWRRCLISRGKYEEWSSLRSPQLGWRCQNKSRFVAVTRTRDTPKEVLILNEDPWFYLQRSSTSFPSAAEESFGPLRADPLRTIDSGCCGLVSLSALLAQPAVGRASLLACRRPRVDGHPALFLRHVPMARSDPIVLGSGRRNGHIQPLTATSSSARRK